MLRWTTNRLGAKPGNDCHSVWCRLALKLERARFENRRAIGLSIDFSKFFETAKMPAFDMKAVADAQKKNMEALVEANKAAAAGYQEIFKRQVAMFEENVAAVQAQFSDLKMEQPTPESFKAQVEQMKAGYEKSLASLTELTETAKKANTEAFEILKARIEASIEELNALAAKAE